MRGTEVADADRFWARPREACQVIWASIDAGSAGSDGRGSCDQRMSVLLRRDGASQGGFQEPRGFCGVGQAQTVHGAGASHIQHVPIDGLAPVSKLLVKPVRLLLGLANNAQRIVERIEERTNRVADLIEFLLRIVASDDRRQAVPPRDPPCSCRFCRSRENPGVGTVAISARRLARRCPRRRDTTSRKVAARVRTWYDRHLAIRGSGVVFG
jgi:hypothetical protein